MEVLLPYLRFAYYTQHRNKFSKDFVFDKRETTCFELVYFLDDSDCKMLLDDKYYSIKGGTVVFRHPNQINQSFMPYESILIGFDFKPVRLDKVKSNENVYSLINDIPVCNNNLKQVSYRKLFEDIYKEVLIGRQCLDYYTSAKIMEILYSLYYEKHTSITHDTSNATDSRLVDILRYMHNYKKTNFSVHEMSCKLAISERLIYKLFSDNLQTTPIAYMNECRLNYSQKLLANSNIPINEVASMSGYANSTYFITLFKKKYGVTPFQYRKQQSKQY